MTADEGSGVHVTSHSKLVWRADGEGSPLSWFQERLWVHHQRNPESTSYNLPFFLAVEGDLDVSA
jgi:hypothetical protein